MRAVAHQRTRQAEQVTDRERPKPVPVLPEDRCRERYPVGTPEEVADGQTLPHREARDDPFCFLGRPRGVYDDKAPADRRRLSEWAAPSLREAAGAG